MLQLDGQLFKKEDCPTLLDRKAKSEKEREFKLLGSWMLPLIMLLSARIIKGYHFQAILEFLDWRSTLADPDFDQTVYFWPNEHYNLLYFCWRELFQRNIFLYFGNKLISWLVGCFITAQGPKKDILRQRKNKSVFS